MVGIDDTAHMEGWLAVGRVEASAGAAIIYEVYNREVGWYMWDANIEYRPTYQPPPHCPTYHPPYQTSQKTY